MKSELCLDICKTFNILKMCIFIYPRGRMMMPVFMIKLSGNYQIKLLLILFIFANLWKMLYVHAFLMTQGNNWREKNHHKALIWSKLLVHDRIQKLFCIFGVLSVRENLCSQRCKLKKCTCISACSYNCYYFPGLYTAVVWKTFSFTLPVQKMRGIFPCMC